MFCCQLLLLAGDKIRIPAKVTKAGRDKAESWGGAQPENKDGAPCYSQTCAQFSWRHCLNFAMPPQPTRTLSPWYFQSSLWGQGDVSKCVLHFRTFISRNLIFAAGLSVCLLVVVLDTKDQILTLCPVLTIKCPICRGEAHVSIFGHGTWPSHPPEN